MEAWSASNSKMPIELKPYRANWSGQVVLACRKCQKKLKKDGQPLDGVGLKKAVGAANKRHRGGELHVIQVPCMDLCPKDGVTVCLPSASSEQLFIVRNGEDLDRLYVQGRTGAEGSPE
jgi:predicted metal-binding protein